MGLQVRGHHYRDTEYEGVFLINVYPLVEKII